MRAQKVQTLTPESESIEEFEEAKHKMEAKNKREPAPAAPATPAEAKNKREPAPAAPATPAAKPEASPASKSADQQERGKKEIWSSLSVPPNLSQVCWRMLTYADVC